MGGGHDEREQTNQLLVEMDGFYASAAVILIAATNRRHPRPPRCASGPVRPPDRRRGARLAEAAHDPQGPLPRGKPMAEDLDLLSVARRTPGFTGADLANVLNEAALLTARQNSKLIDDEALDEAIDRVIAGPQKRTRLMSEKEKLITAYHEGGHALVAAALRHRPGAQGHDPAARPRAGYTMVLPDEDKYSQTRSEMLDKLAYMLSGRAAEEMVFHDPTTGAGNDIDKATSLAQAMVTQYGMTERLGAIKLGRPRASRSSAATWAHPQLLRGRRRRGRRGDQAAPRHRPPGGLRHPRGEPRRPRLAGARADGAGDARTSASRSPRSSSCCAAVRYVPRGLGPRPGPSRIPPVEVPKSAANGSGPEETQGAVILTPPGSGGDVHGDHRELMTVDRIGQEPPRGHHHRPPMSRGGGARAADRGRRGP